MEIKKAWSKTQTVMAVIVAALIAIALYALVVRSAWHGTQEQPLRVVERLPDSPSTVVTLEVEDVESNYSVLQANLTVLPGAQLLDPVTRSLKDDLTVAVSSVAKPTTITWSKGTFPGVVPVPLTLAGNVELWPFDRYRSGPVSVEVYTGAEHRPFRAEVTFFDQMPGWKVESVPSKRGDLLPTYRIKLHRSAGATAYDIVVLAVLVAIACVAATVSILTIQGRRKFQPPMTTWYAAMLFSVVPLRNAFPGAPPFGSNIDLVLVLWVIVVMVASMLGYIYCWWRDLRPAPAGS